MEGLKKILNKSSDYIYNLLEKVSDSIKKDTNSLKIKSIIKLCVLIFIYIILGFISNIFISLGTNIIYYFGTSARGFLSSIWSIVVNFTYFLFIIFTLYKLSEIAQKDKKFFSLYENQKKDNVSKKKIFITLNNIIKIIVTIILIPLFVIDIALLYIFGIMFGYLNQGIYLYSLFLGVIGLILFFTLVIFIIKKMISPNNISLKKNLYLLILSGLIVSGSSIGLLFETSSYASNDSLTTDFNKSVITHEYKISSNKDMFIYHNGNDKNMKLVIDDDLGSYVRVVITHYTTNQIHTNLNEENNNIKVNYSEDLDLDFNDLEKILNLGITCIKEKTIYNYTLLKYATIEVRVSSEYAKNIKFVDSSRKEYIPYERNN